MTEEIKEEDFNKFCILFAVDEATEKIISIISRVLIKKHRPLFVPREVGGLPYHMTIIGGIKLLVTEGDQKIREAVKVLKPFQSPEHSPKLRDIEALKMYGDFLGIRLKFRQDSAYVISGDIQKNEELVGELNEDFDLDDIRHISVGTVKGGFTGMDIVRPTFKRLLAKHKKELMKMRLIPQVWAKSSTKNTWRYYGLK